MKYNGNFCYEEGFVPIAISINSLDAIFKLKNKADCLALYVFYYYTALWQKTNCPKVTTGYAINGLGMSEERVRKAKSQLIDAGLIQNVRRVDSDNKITGWYIKINYVSIKNPSKKTIVVKNGVHPLDFPEGGNFLPQADPDTNALCSGNINALCSNTTNACNTTEASYSSNTDNSDIKYLLSDFPKNEKSDQTDTEKKGKNIFVEENITKSVIQTVSPEDTPESNEDNLSTKNTLTTEKTWRNDFETYKKIVDDAYNDLLNNEEELNTQKKFYTGVNIKMSLQKAHHNFWGKEEGWNFKKKKKIKTLNMKSTLINAIGLNKVYYPKNPDGTYKTEKKKVVYKELDPKEIYRADFYERV